LSYIFISSLFFFSFFLLLCIFLSYIFISSLFFFSFFAF